MTTVFLLGATGFLGGTVLSSLEKAGYEITSLVRSGKEDKLSSRKTKVEVGDFSQLDKIEQLAAQHDAVINAATSDDLDLTKAINRGLATGRKNGKKGVLVHVSGVQLIESSGGSGNWEDVPFYDDSDLSQIKGISEKALHRYIDLEVERADLAGEIVGSIICPGLIYGTGTGPDKVVSELIPDVIDKALDGGKVLYAGDGKNEWSDIHVQDVADLMLLSLEHNLKATEPAGFERFYL